MALKLFIIPLLALLFVAVPQAHAEDEIPFTVTAVDGTNIEGYGRNCQKATLYDYLGHKIDDTNHCLPDGPIEFDIVPNTTFYIIVKRNSDLYYKSDLFTVEDGELVETPSSLPTPTPNTSMTPNFTVYDVFEDIALATSLQYCNSVDCDVYNLSDEKVAHISGASQDTMFMDTSLANGSYYIFGHIYSDLDYENNVLLFEDYYSGVFEVLDGEVTQL